MGVKKKVVEVTEGVEAPDADTVHMAVPPLRYFKVSFGAGVPSEIIASHMLHTDQGILCFVTFKWSDYASSHVSQLSRMIRDWTDCKEVEITVPESDAVN